MRGLRAGAGIVAVAVVLTAWPAAAQGTVADYQRAMGLREKYEKLFGPLPDLSGLPEHAGPNGSPEVRAAWEALDEKKRDEVNRAFANLGKAIAAYERKLQPGPSRFDRYVDAIAAHDEDDRLSLIKRLMEQRGHSTKMFPPRAVQSLISAAKNRMVPPEELAASAPFDRLSPDESLAAGVVATAAAVSDGGVGSTGSVKAVCAIPLKGSAGTSSETGTGAVG